MRAAKYGYTPAWQVLSVTGTKLTLSMKDADQRNGEDLTPNMRLPGQKDAPAASSSNPMRPVGEGGGKRKLDDESDEPGRVTKRLTSPEKFEAKQLIASGVLDVRDYPQFDETHGMAAVEETEEELEIELNEVRRTEGIQPSRPLIALLCGC